MDVIDATHWRFTASDGVVVDAERTASALNLVFTLLDGTRHAYAFADNRLVPIPAPSSSATPTVSVATEDGHEGQVPVNVRTTRCGTSESLSGRVFVQLRAGEFSSTDAAVETGPGTYSAYLPSGATHIGVSPQEIANGAVALIAALCSGLGEGPDGLAVLLSAAEGCVVAGPAASACFALFGLVSLYCEASNLTQGAFDRVVASVVSLLPERALTGQVNAYFEAVPQNIVGPTVDLIPTQSVVDLTLDDALEVIEGINLVPPQPNAGEAYRATATVRCAKDGTGRFSVVGSDGYTAQADAGVSAGRTVDRLDVTLDVPSAREGTIDRLTISREPRSTAAQSRSTEVTFGSGTDPAVLRFDSCAIAPSAPGTVRPPSVCYRRGVSLVPGRARPLSDFVVIDQGNDERVTSMYIGLGFFSNSASQLSILGSTSQPRGQVYYYGSELYPFYTHTQGTDIYYGCQGLPNPHPDVLGALSLNVDSSFTATSIEIPVFIVQYQRKSQSESCAAGGYLPFTRVNIVDCPNGATGICDPFVIPVDQSGANP